MRKNKKSPILNAIYEIASDLHCCGGITNEQMKKYEELAPKSAHFDLDYDVFECINQKYGSNREKLQVLINDLLRKQLNISQPVL